MRVVNDTNVVASSFIARAGNPARVMAAWRAGRYELVVSPALLTEYEEILNRPRIQRRHGRSHTQVATDIADLARIAINVVPTEVPAVIAEDPDHDHVLAAALAGEANYIVSGNSDLLNLREYQGIRILSPAAFLALLAADQQLA